jgi:hypothetical protein
MSEVLRLVDREVRLTEDLDAIGICASKKKPTV